MDGLAEDGGFVNVGEEADGGEDLHDVRASDFETSGAGRVGGGKALQFVHRAEGDELGVIKIADAAAALGFVHVMGGDEKGDPLAGEEENEVPEGAAGDGVDAGGGFIEEDDFGGVDDGAGEGEALFPAAGELAGAAVEVGGDGGEGDDIGEAAGVAVGGEAVDSGVEFDVFADGEVFVEAEALGHVTDALADLGGVLADVEIEEMTGAGGDFDEAAEGLDDGRFAGSVRAEKAEDFAAFDGEGHFVDGGEVAEADG